MSLPADPVRAFVLILEIDLHFPGSTNLKAKRSELAPVKAHLHNRLGATVAEVAHQDRWQRATLVAALVGGSARRLHSAADGLEGWLDARLPAGARVERRLASVQDIWG